MKTLPLGEWLPDQPEYMNPGSPNVLNLLWVAGSYVPAQAFASLGQAVSARVQGAVSVTDASDNIHIYAGTGTQLLEYVDTGFVNLSAGGGSPYTLADEEYWKFCQFTSPGFGNLLFATDFSDALQQIEPGVDSAFSATVASVGTVPKAAQIGNIGQFVMVGDTEEPINGHVPYRVQWCGIDDPTNWDLDTLTAQQAQAGEQFMNANHGAVTHISNGGTYGLIFQERAITRAYYVGGNSIFDFNGVIDQQRGCFFPNSPVQIGAAVYFIAHDGFCMCDGMQVAQIGQGKTDLTFLADVSQNYRDRVHGSYDPIHKLIYWCYCSSGNSTGIPDKVIVYNYAENKFTTTTQDLSIVFTSQSSGYTMEDLDNVNLNLDLITPSLDSPYWQGGNYQIGAFDSSNNYGSLTGAALDATIDTQEADPNTGGMTFLEGLRPIFTDSAGSGVATVTPLTRDTENAAYTVGSAAAYNSRTGICEMRASARYVRARIQITGGFDLIAGCDVYGQPAGEV